MPFMCTYILKARGNFLIFLTFIFDIYFYFIFIFISILFLFLFLFFIFIFILFLMRGYRVNVRHGNMYQISG